MRTTDLPLRPSTPDLECDWRFAELVVWTHLDPELRARYAVDPRAVLAEFDVVLPTGTAVPPLRRPQHPPVVVEDLGRAAAAMMSICLSPGE
ncbi:hypothetical protein KCMC57_up42790 [Kitasatospora sp. CMC57]|uniref:Uncharacterized protein n=1 Tax=Kitasatospora sp. CMC57 TaxID=3231513 RepID=A0AB33K611_9ACTN